MNRAQSSLRRRLLTRTGPVGVDAHKLDDPDAALTGARSAVARDRRNARAWSVLGEMLAGRQEFDESRRCYETVIGLDPNDVASRHNLANVLQALGIAEEAETRYREVLDRAPGNDLARVNFACLLNTLGRYDEAWAAVEKAISRNPAFAMAHLVASSIQYNRGRYKLALEQLEQAIVLVSDGTELLIRRAEILCKLGRYQAALSECDAVLKRLPADAKALQVRASVLRAMHRPEEALDALCSVPSASADPGLTVDRAWLLAELGRKDEALQLLDQTLSSRPGLPSALYCRAFLSRHKPGHPNLAIMERIAANTQAPSNDRMVMLFALGRAHLDAEDGEKAFRYLDRANALKRAAVTYDRRVEERWFNRIVTLSAKQNMAHLLDCGISTAQPIFVFGMPRSGTTLMEQILASHSSVRGKGEMPYLDMVVRSCILEPGPAGLTADNLRSCANRYLEMVGTDASPQLHFVDKTPSNYLFAGLISVLFPRARMIHCRRDALDTCLSCYSLLFGHGVEYSYNQTELGHHYGLYRKTMAHWKTSLPADAILDVDYEALVTDTKEQIGRVLDFCSLSWDDACLSFHKTDRHVSTSSLDQVRSPMYRTSIGRAAMFRPWLRALEQSLNENGGLAS